MDESTLDALHADEDSLKSATLVAEEIIQLLPATTALAVRRCIVLHWFDLSIVEAILEDRELTIDEMSDIYQQLAAMPFIDTIHLGLTFQSETRQGLLRSYSAKQPELLQAAARLAAPVYEAYEEDERNIAEAFFCSIVAEDQKTSIALQTALFKQGSRHDWHYFEHLFQLQDEAERLPFVLPLLRTEQYFLLSGLVHRMNGRQDAALLAYNQAIALNPKSVLAYINRGITYAEQERFNKALHDYNIALQIDKNAIQVYANRGVVYTKKSLFKKALKDFKKAINAGLLNSFVLLYQGESLYQLGRYEEALSCYDKMLRLDSEDVEAHLGRGKLYNRLKNYEQALISFEVALSFNPDSAEAYRGRGYAFNRLERYAEALAAYDRSLELDENSAEAHGGRGKALSGLKQFAEHIQADNLSLSHQDMDRYILVDGYNVIKNGLMFHTLEMKSLGEARLLLIRQLHNRYRHTTHRVIVVFDGDGKQEQISYEEHIRIIYSRYGETADSVIKRLSAEARLAGGLVQIYSDGEDIRHTVTEQGDTIQATNHLMKQIQAAPRDIAIRSQHRHRIHRIYHLDTPYKLEEDLKPDDYPDRKKKKRASRRRR